MKSIHPPAALAAVAVSFALAAPGAPAAELNRTVLPIKEPLRATTDIIDVRKATPPPRFNVKAPRLRDPRPIAHRRQFKSQVINITSITKCKS